MFNKDFYPTPVAVIDEMMEGYTVRGRVVYDPQAGKGDILKWAINNGAADVIASETDPQLREILKPIAPLIGDDFLKVESHQVSHVDFIIMNPPFSDEERHILHAFEICPPGCQVISLCNSGTIRNTYTQNRRRLEQIINQFGSSQNLGAVFAREAERRTGVEVSVIRISKPAEDGSRDNEFSGFYLEEDPEEQQGAANGIMKYNEVRDVVNRYVAAVKTYDQMLAIGQQMDSVLSGFYGHSLAFTCTQDGAPMLRNRFKKALQKAGWEYIFEKLNMEKYATRGLKEDINKFVEERKDLPFTMRNIYRMLYIVVATKDQRMDKAAKEVFEKLTSLAEDNKMGLPGFKTNSHYLIPRKFIVPFMCYQDSFYKQYHPNDIKIRGGYLDYILDLQKVLCHITGTQHEDLLRFSEVVDYQYRFRNAVTGKYIQSKSWKGAMITNDPDEALRYLEALKADGVPAEMINYRPKYGELFEWNFFKCRAFKKGTMHFEFKDESTWELFNKNIARILGYPLFESKAQTAYQERQTGRSTQQKASGWKGAAKSPQAAQKPKTKPTVLFTFKQTT